MNISEARAIAEFARFEAYMESLDPSDFEHCSEDYCKMGPMTKKCRTCNPKEDDDE